MKNPKSLVCISNVDSQAVASASDLALINQVLRRCEPSLRSAAKSTPVYLLNDVSFGNLFDGQRNKPVPPNPQIQNTDDCTDSEYLGVFTTSPIAVHMDPLPCQGPKVFICPERIHASANLSSINYQALLIKLLLHEWMHAAMHVEVDTEDAPANPMNVYLAYAIEEAMANFGALQAMDAMNAGRWNRHAIWGQLVNDAIAFAERQPPEYALGATMFKDRGTNFNPRPWFKAKGNSFDLILTICTQHWPDPHQGTLRYANLVFLWNRALHGVCLA